LVVVEQLVHQLAELAPLEVLLLRVVVLAQVALQVVVDGVIFKEFTQPIA